MEKDVLLKTFDERIRKVEELFFEATLWLDQLDYAETLSPDGSEEYYLVLRKLITEIHLTYALLDQIDKISESEEFDYDLFMQLLGFIAFFIKIFINNEYHDRQLPSRFPHSSIRTEDIKKKLISIRRELITFQPSRDYSYLFYLIKAGYELLILCDKKLAIEFINRLGLENLNSNGKIDFKSIVES
jgi:hypothetical protein